MRFIQHKQEAYWFYRVVSLVYDRWVNPLFWTTPMRDRALELARLEQLDGEVVDVGAGTGFTTEGIVAHVSARTVTMLDQSPHQLTRARAKPPLAEVDKHLGDAENLPFPTDRFERYVSAGSIEYWPDPERGIAEAYRVLKPDGRALVIGPVRPANPIARRLADAWMLFPTEDEYRTWMEQAGFADVEVTALAPEWYTRSDTPFAVAIAGRKPTAGPSPLPLAQPPEPPRAAPTPLRIARFAAGSLAGLAFVPLGIAMTVRARLRSRAAAA